VKNLPAGRQVSAFGAAECQILRFAQNDKERPPLFGGAPMKGCQSGLIDLGSKYRV
jgi:hypothetical protein